MVTDTVAAVRRLRSTELAGLILLREDPAFYEQLTVSAGGARVSITVRPAPKVITDIGEDDCTPIEYTAAVYDGTPGRWTSRVEVAEIAFVAFRFKKANQQVRGRLVVRRIPRPQPSRR